MKNKIGAPLVQWMNGNCFKVAPIVLAATVSATPALAQTYSFGSVQVEGNQRVDDRTILTQAGIGRGQSLTAAELNAAAQSIRNSGLFKSVDVTPRGGTLVIEVVEYPTVNRISVEGNRQVRDADLLPAVSSQPRRVYTPSQAERDAAALAEVYASRGRVNTSVTPRIIERPNNRVDLVFEVNEASVTEIERISFVGNRSFSERRLRGALETKQAGLLRAILSADTFLEERIAFDRRALTDFYNARGYADFQVQNVDVVLTRERDAYLVTFNVQEGQRFNFGEITVTTDLPGVDAAMFQSVIRTKPGSVYNPVTLETDIARLERLAIQNGLSFVRADPVITRNDRALTLDVNFQLVRGERVFIERINIEGNTTTLDRVVRNQFRVVEGDPFNPREIRQAADRIRALGYFANANVDAREGSSPDQVVVDVDVEEGPTGSLSFGANYNTDTGIGLLATFRERNFLGRGQSLNVQLSTAESNRRFSFSFSEPQLLGRDLRGGLQLSYKSTDNENALYDTESFQFRPSLGFPVSENGRLSVFYSFDHSDLFDVDAGASTVIQNEAIGRGISTHSLGYTYSYDTRRTGLNPSAGVLLRFGQEFGIGDADYIKTSAEATAETRLMNEELTLRATIEGGLLDYSSGDSRVTDRYFLGSRVMRGFEPGGIGPRDADTDDALGGNAYAVARLEAEFPIGLPEEYGITGGLFVDYGSVWDVGNTYGANVVYDDFTARSVAGISIFWDTPVGPLRFNFMEPLDVQPLDNTKDFDVTISTSF